MKAVSVVLMYYGSQWTCKNCSIEHRTYKLLWSHLALQPLWVTQL